MEGKRREIKKDLFDSGCRDLTVHWIQGEAGSGKTYFAELLFKDSMEHRFTFRGWISGDPAYNLRDALEGWLLFFNPNHETFIAALSDENLKKKIIEELKKKRYLIVVDDVSSCATWNSLKDYLPNGKNGSRVIVTTTDTNVARKVGKTWTQMSPLTDEREKRKCCGFENDEDENDEKVRIMTACFRYLGQFPAEKAISVEKLGLLLMAEETIKTDPEMLPWEVTQEYLNELTERKLVVNVENDDVHISERFASFKIHRSIQKVCRDEALKANALKVLDKESKCPWWSNFSGKKSEEERLVVHLNELKSTNVLAQTRRAQPLKSILFFDLTEKNASKSVQPDQVEYLMKFQSTRVLEFHEVDFQSKKFPIEKIKSDVAALEELKYLSFQGCQLDVLTKLISDCPSLETLDLRVKKKMTIPNFLHKLASLKHLYFPQDYNLPKGDSKLNLATLTKLRILENFHTDKCNSGDWKKFEELQSLMVIIENDDKDIKNLILAIEDMALHHMSLVLKKFHLYKQERRQAMEDILKCNAIHILDVEGKFHDHFNLPSVMGKNFTKMTFRKSEFGEDSWSALQTLSNLKSLVLCDDAFIKEDMEFPEDCFPKLTILELKALRMVKNLTVKKGALRSLVVLKIVKCDKLEKPLSVFDKLENLQKLILGLEETDKFQDEVIEINRKGGKKILLLPSTD